MATIYDLNTLVEVLRVQKNPTSFFLPNWFQRGITFDTDKIMFDRVYGDDRFIAPFVVPEGSGRKSSLLGYDTVSFAPAYVKMKDMVDPRRVFERMAGEALGVGSLTPQQRYDANVAETLRQQNVKLQNLFEVMAAKAIIDASITISGEEYPTTTVDFRRDASLSATLTTTAKWDTATADPMGDLKTMRVRANNLSGAQISRMIFGGDAWSLFCTRVDVKEMMNKFYGGQETNVTLISDGYEGVEYMGTIQGLNGAGRMECYVHTGKYRDYETGTENYHLDQKTVIGVSDMVEGVRCFGAIKHKAAGWLPMEKFPNMWTTEDGSVDFMELQSAPLMVPKKPNATFKIKVAT